jgi:hypothetical protein
MRLQTLTVAAAFLVGTWAGAQTPAKPEAGPPKAESKPAAPAAAPAAPAASAAVASVKPDSPCKQDVEALCANVQPGAGRIYHCLREHQDEVSNTCKARLADLRSTGAECKEDIEKFCASVPHAKGAVAKCLAEHHDDLSERCKALSALAKGTPGTAAKEGAAAAAPSTPAPTPAAPAATPVDAGTKK